MTNQQFIQLLHQWRAGTIAREEALALFEAVKSGNYDELLDNTLQSHWDANDLLHIVKVEGKEEVLNRLLDRYRPQPHNIRTTHRVHFLRTAWFRYAAAIILLFGTGAYLWNAQQKEKPLITESKPVPVKNDIAPGFDRAVLTLSNGQQVVLDNAGSETINDGSLSIKNSKGELVYGGNPPAPHGATPFSKGGVAVSPVFNTMATPKGGQYKLTLADGTKVWLNAASSVTFPTAFTGNTREVSITGEAYFEVAKNKEKPFIVNVAYLLLAGVAPQAPRVDRERSERTGGYTITVLGTSFNVHAYPDETNRTSLLEGSVNINNRILKPGQAYEKGKIITTDVAADIAWKNGFFNLEKITLEQAMRHFARWYDIEVVYDEGIPNEKLSGKMDRNLTLKDALLGLEGVVAHFRLEGRTVHVKPL